MLRQEYMFIYLETQQERKGGDMKDIIKREIIAPIKEKIIDRIQDELKEKLELPF